MSLFTDDDKPLSPPLPPTIQPKPRIESEIYRGITIDTNYTPSSALLLWVEGANWTVDYFSQVLDLDTEPTPLNLDRDPIYQQYRRIRGMHLKVTDPLNFSQDQPSQVMQVTGSGLTYPFLVPNIGDMFIADIGDGRAGVFTVTEATRATILKDSVYNISYLMVGELNPDYLNDLERKTIEELHYSQASLVSGCGPFVTPQENTRRKRYSQLYLDLLDRYLTDFLSIEHSTLLVPDQNQKVYDHYVIKALLQTVEGQLDRRLNRIRELNTSMEVVFSQATLWDAIVRLRESRLHGCSQTVSLVSTAHFKGQPAMQSLGYTGIPRVVYPKEVAVDVDSYYHGRTSLTLEGLNYLEGRPRRPLPGPHQSQAERNLRFFQRGTPLEGIETWKLPPDIHPVVIDDYYVLSKAFYTDEAAQQSKLEMLILQLVRREALNLPQFDQLLEQVLEWDNLERYYYYPLVLILLKRAGAR